MQGESINNLLSRMGGEWLWLFEEKLLLVDEHPAMRVAIIKNIATSTDLPRMSQIEEFCINSVVWFYIVGS